MSYIQSDGLVRMEINTPVENGLLFRAYLDWFRLLNGTELKGLSYIAYEGATYVRDGKLWFQSNPPERGPHFSRDNMWGYYCESIMLNKPIRHLPAFIWNCKKIKKVAPPAKWWSVKAWLYYWYYKDQNPRGVWLNPNGWMVFLALKYKFFLYLFAPCLLIMYHYSRYSNRKVEKSSGSCLWAMMAFFLWGVEPEEWELEEFKTYITNNGRYVNPDNPILLEIALYKELML